MFSRVKKAAQFIQRFVIGRLSTTPQTLRPPDYFKKQRTDGNKWVVIALMLILKFLYD